MEPLNESQELRHSPRSARSVCFVDQENETADFQPTMHPPSGPQDDVPAQALDRQSSSRVGFTTEALEKGDSHESGYSWLRRGMSSMSMAAMSIADEMQEELREAIEYDAGDYRVKLRGPDGDIPVDIWDLSKYKWWSFDHYQALRREYVRSRGRQAMQREGELIYILPHPGVDYIYNDCPFVSHAGKMDLVSMSAHCILPDGARLPADLDKNLRATFFSDAGYSIKCNWFNEGHEKQASARRGVGGGLCC